MIQRWAVPVLAVLLILAPQRVESQSKGLVDVWLTSSDRSSQFAKQATPLVFRGQGGSLPVIEVSDSVRLQKIDGFGFALTGGSAQLLMRMDSRRRSELLKELFATEGASIGVSYLRVSIGSSDMNERVFTYDDLPPGEQDEALSHFSLGPDKADVIPVLKQILAINPKISILGSPWSAPSWMKTNGKPKGGSLRPELYDSYARYFVKYIKGMAEEGIRIDAITVQNEPLNEKNTPSMYMSAAQQANFIKASLGPIFRKSGITTKIILYDHNCDEPGYPLEVLHDADARQYVDGSGFHLYGGEVSAMTKVHEEFPDKNVYFTEQMVVEREKERTFKIAAPVSRVVIGAMRNWSRNVLLWNLAADPQYGPHTDDGGCPVCQGAITLDGDVVTRNVAYYTIAHAAKFVRPGSFRISSDTSSEALLPNVAFETPDGDKVLIVANTSTSAQTFSVRFHGKAFPSSLGGGDVATFHWR